MASKVKRMIPDDIVSEILQWFPPKPLAKFLCISKNWRSMILDEINKRNSKEEKVVMMSESSFQSVDFTDPNEIKDTALLKFPVYTVGYANGILSYIDTENTAFVLFNPWTQERRTIKVSDTLLPNLLTSKSSIYGFGYDKNNDNYVLVVIFTVDWANYNKFAWTSKAQNWIPISDSLDRKWWRRGVPLTQRILGLCASGCIYWLTRSGIVCFNLKTFKFNGIEEPSGFTPHRHLYRHLRLVVWEDSLRVVEFIHRGEGTHVWELDGEMQWIKIMTIPKFITSRGGFRDGFRDVRYEYMSPVLRLKKGDIMASEFLSQENERLIGWSTKRRLIGWTTKRRPTWCMFHEDGISFTRLKSTGMNDFKLFPSVRIPYKNNLLLPVVKEDGSGRHPYLE